ncbi:preprotein translocase subunit YajC [Anaerovoracaceae bacterium 42-11]|nr:preprotein translocase subunit YajC [Emergencia sp.]
MSNGGGNAFAMQLIILVVFIGAMYFLLIRPQKKKEKTIQQMRNTLQVGDEIITIGGICGKIVKTKEDSIVIQVGADKVKFEMMRWAVSSVVSSSKTAAKSAVAEDEEEKKIKPKRLRKAADEEENIPEDEK